MLENITVLNHSNIKFDKDIIIYFDPFNIEREYKDADIIFITHSHYDHYSEKDIIKIIKHNTIIIAPKDLEKNLKNLNLSTKQIYLVQPNKSYQVYNINFQTIPSYNTNKNFHPKENNWVGYIITLNNYQYYIAGDTDITEEAKKVKCDVAFLPVGGTYTMTSVEASDLANIISPKIAIPIHYGSVVGTKQDAIDFINNLNKNIKGVILMKKQG